uniref:Serine aminopeptidase S33 domain-containing protein n=1 Tax=Panagrolaimus superbus TaxID=310955 RepID=A0A914YXD7_9BILA
MWLFDVLSAIAFEDDDPLTFEERKGAGAEASDSVFEEEEKITTEEETTTIKTVIEDGKAKASESVVSKKLQATKTTMTQHGFVGSILNCCHCLATCCLFTYVLCPPVPSCIIRKVAFRPPKQGESYKLIVKDKNGKEKYVGSARAASKYSSLQIEPILLEQRQHPAHFLRCFMQPVDGFIVKSKSGNSLVCAHFKNKYTNLRTTKIYNNKVAIFAQPNSSDIGHFMQPFIVSFRDFAHSIGIDLYGFDYSGYGRSGGTASEQNAYDDIESVFSEIVKRRGSEIEILLIGFSIGTTAVIDLASKKPKNLFGVVLIAPFTSGVRLLKNAPRLEKTPWYDCFESYTKISHVEVPVLVCHGTEDSMIPLLHGQVLYERAPQKVDPVIVDGANHVSILQSQHVHLAIRLFVAKQLQNPSSPLKEASTINNRSDSNSEEEK